MCAPSLAAWATPIPVTLRVYRHALEDRDRAAAESWGAFSLPSQACSQEAEDRMTTIPEVTVIGLRYWLDKPEQLAQVLKTSRATSISDPSGQPMQADEIVVLTCREVWAENPRTLKDALAAVLGVGGAHASDAANSTAAVAPIEDRLVFTVEEAAQLLGISRSFAYEAVQRGGIPAMRIGRRILVPKAALDRFLSQEAGIKREWKNDSSPSSRPQPTYGQLVA